jgi:hypothetical protein
MSKLTGFLASLALSATVAAQDGGGPCATNDPTLYLLSPGASGSALVKRYAWGNTRELEVTARLRTAFTEPGTAVEGYSISVEHTESPFQLLEVTDGTNEISSRGFVRTEIVDRGPRRGFVSAAVVCDCSLPPIGDFPLVRARYHVDFGAETLPFLELAGRIEYRDGLQGSGQPVANVLMVRGSPLVPCLQPLDVPIRLENPDFVRGDANFDGVLDISDAVKLLHSQFTDGATLRCDDAGDANDDGEIDISDPIHILGYLFGEGPPPPDPFPWAGWDLTWDELGCFPEASG